MWAVRVKQQQRQWPWLIGLSWDLLYLFVYFGIPVNGTQSLMHHSSLTNALASQHVGNFRYQKVMFYPESLFFVDLQLHYIHLPYYTNTSIITSDRILKQDSHLMKSESRFAGGWMWNVPPRLIPNMENAFLELTWSVRRVCLAIVSFSENPFWK